MTDRHGLLAYAVTLIAICYLATIAALLAYTGRYAEALGFGGLTTGLVGVLGTFKPRTPTGDATLDKAIEKIPPVTGDAASSPQS